MPWNKLSSTTLTTTGDSIDSGTITASTFNTIIGHVISSSTDINRLSRFNGDTGNNYQNRYSSNGGADATSTAGSTMFTNSTGAQYNEFGVAFFADVSGEEKMLISNAVGDSASTGAGTAPDRRNTISKWTGTADVTVVNGLNSDVGDYIADSNVMIMGNEVSVDALATNLQTGTRYEETDTRKMYNFVASSDFDFSANSSGAVSNQPTDATEVGQLITSTTHRGKKAKSATFYVQRVGSPGGTMVYKIRKSSDNSVVATSAGTSASGLSTSKTAVTLDFNDEDIPSENIRVTVSGVTGSSGNLVTIYGGGSDTVADQRLSVWGGSSWTEYDNDCAGQLTFTEEWVEIGA